MLNVNEVVRQENVVGISKDKQIENERKSVIVIDLT